ncbi:MAG: bacteriocin [Oscillospiraceae bacterium]
MKTNLINTSAFTELTSDELNNVDGGDFKSFLEGLDYLNQKWDSWKASFRAGWNSYPY